MTFTPSFYRSVAVCSIVSAITTLGLIYLPEFFQPPTDSKGACDASTIRRMS